MGIVRKQSIIGSLLIYVGAGLGFVTSGLLFPRFLSQEQIGLISILVTYSLIFAQLASAGFLQTITRLFPYFRNTEAKHNGFLFVTLMVVTVGSVIITGVYFISKPLILSNATHESSLLAQFSWLIIPLFIATVFFNILDSYTKALFNGTRGIVLKEVILRLFILISLGLFIFNIVDFTQFIYLYIICNILIVLIIILQIAKDKQLHLKPDFTKFDSPMIKEIAQVSLFGIIISATTFVIVNIDRIMIEKMLGESALAQVGIYATCTFFSTMVILPSRPLLKISSTLASEAWKRNDMNQIQLLYTKSTITQLIIGLLVFLGLCINIDYIFHVIPKSFEPGAWVIIWIGVYFLSDMASGINSIIISVSPYYKYLSHLTIVLIFLLIGLNLIFIPQYGIVGAAFASALAKIIYNISIFIFVHKKFKLQPYSRKHLYILAIGLISFVVTYYIPETKSIIANIIIKSISITALFSTLIYVTKVSPEVTEIVSEIKKKLGK